MSVRAVRSRVECGSASYAAPYEIKAGPGFLVATAIHAGHGVRPEIAKALRVDDDERRREEDPFTGTWVRIASNRVTVHVSRFEVDLNRPRDSAVYAGPDAAWGLDVWGGSLDEGAHARSMALYDRFYSDVGRLLDGIVTREGGVLVYDLHSFNHRRLGPDAEPAPQADYPDVNVGTGNIDRGSWAPVVEAFIGSMRERRVRGARLDVRENVCFRGGHFGRWITEAYPRRSCVLSIEVKKIFMDEWSHRLVPEALKDVHDALGVSVATVLDAFEEALAERTAA